MCKMCALVYVVDTIHTSDLHFTNTTNDDKLDLGAVSMLVGHNMDKYNNWVDKHGVYTTRFIEQITLAEFKLKEQFYDSDISVMQYRFKQMVLGYSDTYGMFLKDILKAYKSH